MLNQFIDINILRLLEKKFGIIGNSDVMQQAITMLLQAAPTDLTVLITGETGTGKEVFANAIHGLSNRKKLPFVSVNCGAIPETLLEAELFGSEKGAYTGSHEQRKGFFEVANKGTILLDEIGDMPIATQVKLLRILESGEYSRLGSSTVHKVDVRVIAATNRSLEEEVQKGNFRQDLFFRLNSVHIYLPPLRTHNSDIPILYEHFAKSICEKIGLNYEGMNNDTIEIMQVQPWNGNVRELKNLIETMITLEKTTFLTPEILRKYIRPTLPPYVSNDVAPGSSLITLKQENTLPNLELGLIFRTLLDMQNEIKEIKGMTSYNLNQVAEIKSNMHSYDIQNTENSSKYNNKIDIDELKLEEMEKLIIENILLKYEGNRRLAAKHLGISNRTLYRKLDNYGIKNIEN